eukprot:764075-Hanusia_phi.AAC.5
MGSAAACWGRGESVGRRRAAEIEGQGGGCSTSGSCMPSRSLLARSPFLLTGLQQQVTVGADNLFVVDPLVSCVVASLRLRGEQEGKYIECFMDQKITWQGSKYFLCYPSDTPVAIARLSDAQGVSEVSGSLALPQSSHARAGAREALRGPLRRGPGRAGWQRPRAPPLRRGADSAGPSAGAGGADASAARGPGGQRRVRTHPGEVPLPQ